MKHVQIKGRRNFIKNTAAGSVAFGLGFAGLQSFAATTASTNPAINNPFFTGLDQQPLPYAYNALEDAIDAMTMEIHYSKHAAGYAKNLKEAVKAEGLENVKNVEEILPNISRYSAKMRNNAGGHYNHELFWQCMRPKRTNNAPAGKMLVAIEDGFGTWTAFKVKFEDAAKTRFGSGWAWLYADANKKLHVSSTANQDNTLMDINEAKGTPILGIDVWEHAYYLKYQNKRADYIENWWNIVNWDFVQQRLEKI